MVRSLTLIRVAIWTLTPCNSSAQTTYISYKAWAVILLRGGQSGTVTAITSFLPTVLTPEVDAEGLDGGGPIPEWCSLRALPHLPDQTVLESECPSQCECYYSLRLKLKGYEQ